MAYEVDYCQTKEQFKHFAEVVTGKTDGSPSGQDIDTSTLPYTGQERLTLAGFENKLDEAIFSSANFLPTKIPTIDYGSGFIVLSPNKPGEYPINQGVRYSSGSDYAIYRFAGDESELPYDLSQPFDESKWVDAASVIFTVNRTVVAVEGQIMFGPFMDNGAEISIDSAGVYCNGKKQKVLDGTGVGSYIVTEDNTIMLNGWSASEGDIFEFEVNVARNYDTFSSGATFMGYNNILNYTSGGKGVDITPSLQQAIIDSYSGGKPSTVLIPSNFYGELRSKSNVNSAIAMYPGVTIQMMSNTEIKNFVPAHMFRTEISFPAGSPGWSITGGRSSVINHNSQSIDDLAKNQLALVNQGDEPLDPNDPSSPTANDLKTWSGYGEEMYNGVFPTLTQYVGWTYGYAQVASAYHCIWPERTEGSRIQGITIRRAHKTAVRSSDTINMEMLDLYADEPRSVGFNLSNNSLNATVQNCSVYSCLQIGIAVFDTDSGTQRGGLYNVRCINDPDRPLGENGIEIQGNYPSENTDFVLDGFQVHHYGSHGVRLVNASNTTVTNGIITQIAKLSQQNDRYPVALAQVGIGLRNVSGSVSRGNVVSNCCIKAGGLYEMVIDNPDNVIANIRMADGLDSKSDGRAYINGVEYLGIGALNLFKDGQLDTPAIAFGANPSLGIYQSGSSIAAMVADGVICGRWGQGDFIAGGTSLLTGTSDVGFLQIPSKIGTQYKTPANSFGGKIPFVWDDDNKRLLAYSADGKYYHVDSDGSFTPDN